jgi:hypothetical protein
MTSVPVDGRFLLYTFVRLCPLCLLTKPDCFHWVSFEVHLTVKTVTALKRLATHVFRI